MTSKTKKTLLTASAIVAGWYLLSKKNNTPTVEGIGAKKEDSLNITTVIIANFEERLDRVYQQWKALKKAKNKGHLFVLRRNIDELNLWLDEIDTTVK